MRTKGLFILAIMTLGVGAAGTWLLWPTAEDPPTEEDEVDTGMSDEATRALLQEIGYLK